MPIYNKQDSVIKQGVRDILFDKAKGSCILKRPNLEIVTLPNTNFNLEKRLLANSNCNINCYETNREKFREAKVPKGIKYSNSDVFSLKNQTFDIVWLDYCNSFCPKIINKTIEFVKNNNFRHNSLLAITFCKARGSKTYYDEHYLNYRHRGFAKHLTQFIPIKVEKVDIIDYSCRDIGISSSPMVLYIFSLKNYHHENFITSKKSLDYQEV